MSEPKWTPGPWEPYRQEGQYGWRIIRPAGDAELGNWMVAERVRREEDARLIAGAPELYEALQFIFEHIADKERGPRDLYPAFGLDATRVIEMTYLALTKARGER